MPRIILAAALVALAGCSLDRIGLGSSEPLGDSSIADTTVAADSLFPTDEVEGDALPETEPEVETDAGCSTTPGDPCTKVALLKAKSTLDGKDTEFCLIDPVDLDVTNAEFLVPGTAEVWATARMRVRVAWAPDGLHAHFAVTDATFAPAPAGDDYWKGDCVELFAAGHDLLTGAFDATRDKGATHIIFTRPRVDGTVHAGIFDFTGTKTGELPGGDYKTLARVDGYDVEVHLTWKSLEGSMIASGSRIALNFALNDRRDLVSADAQYIGYRLVMPLPMGFCGGLSCDDRVWCTPALE